MKHPVSRDLYAYWNALRAGRSAPERGDIDPAAIRHVLPHTFILEVEGEGSRRTISIRLSGTRLNALFRSELKGRFFDEIWAARDIAASQTLVGGVLEDAVGLVAGVSGAPPGDPAIALELLLLPLRHHGRTQVRLLGSLAAMTTPSWIGLKPLIGLELGSFRTLLPQSTRPVVVHSPPLGTMPPGTVHTMPQPAVRRVGRFTIYQGGRRAADRPASADGLVEFSRP